MPLGCDASLAEGFASFFHEKIETIHESFNLVDCLKLPFIFPNELPRISSFKAISLGEIRWLLSKTKTHHMFIGYHSNQAAKSISRSLPTTYNQAD